MRNTLIPLRIVFALPLVLAGVGAAAAADPPQTISQSPPVKVFRGTPVDPFGHPVAHPTVTAVGTVNGPGGTIIVVRGAPNPLPSERLGGFAPPPLASGPTVPPLTGFGGSSSDTRFANRFDDGFDHRFDGRFNNKFDSRFHVDRHFMRSRGTGGHLGARRGTTTPSFASAPASRVGAFGGAGGVSGGHFGVSGGHFGGFGGFHR